MNKRGILILIFLSVLVLSSVAVEAQEEKITDMFNKMGKFLFEDIPAMGEYGFKFLLWIMLFALINFGLTRKDFFDKKVAGILSFTVSLASVIIIPGDTIKHIFTLYGTIIVLALGVFVPVILWWIVHKEFPKNTTGDRIIRAVIYLIIGYALVNFAAYSKPLMEAVT